MSVLLLYPEFPDTFWSFKHTLKFIRKKASLPPLGLLTVAAMLPEQWAKRLVDVNVGKLRDRDLAWADGECASHELPDFRPSPPPLFARRQPPRYTAGFHPMASGQAMRQQALLDVP